jgi:pilus assembly protein Flp/PilA
MGQRYVRRVNILEGEVTFPLWSMSMRHVIDFLRDERAATAIEYGLIITGIALGILSVLSGIGEKIKAAFLLLQAAV